MIDDDAWGEWSAIPLKQFEVVRILSAMLGELYAQPNPVVGHWLQSRTTGWTVVIPRWMLPRNLADSVWGEARTATERAIWAVLRDALDDCTTRLRQLVGEMSAIGSDSDASRGLVGDISRKLPHLLRDHFALSGALGVERQPLEFWLPSPGNAHRIGRE